MTTIKYSKAVLKYEDEDLYVEMDVRVLPANKGMIKCQCGSLAYFLFKYICNSALFYEFFPLSFILSSLSFHMFCAT